MQRAARTLWIAGAIAAVSATAGPPTKLAGEYQLGGLLDEKGVPRAGSSHLYVSLTEDAARSLFAALEGDARDDPCTGYRTKSRGNVSCYEIESDARYFCSFSIDLGRGTVAAGLGGC